MMIRKFTIIFIFLIPYISFTASASPVNLNENLSPSVVSEGINNLQNSEREINKLIEQRLHQAILNRSEENSAKKSLPKLVESKKCLPISGIYMQGISLLSTSDLKTLSAIPSDCITSHYINKLASEITNLYIQKGYVTARVKLIPPDYDKTLGIRIIEGFVEDIREGDRWVNSQTLFPDLKNNPLNIHQLDQGLDQANRLQSNRTTLDILPGTVNGGSIILLNNKHSTPWKVSVTTDNYGQKSTGKWMGRLNTSFDSPLGLSDFISFSGSSTLNNSKKKHNHSYILLYSLPYGEMTFSGFYVDSKYRNKMQLQVRSINIRGNAEQAGMRADWVFHRNQKQIDTLSTQVVYKKGNNYLNDEKLITSSETVSLVSLSVNHLQVIPTGIFTFDIGINKGMPWFDAQTVMDKDFIKGQMSLNLKKSFILFKSSYFFDSELYTQYSRNRLPAMECIDIGDKNNIRGFNGSFLCSDNGWYLRNTLSYPIPIPQGSLTLSIGGDLGQSKSYSNKGEWINAIGLNAGMTLRYQQLFADIQVSQGKILSPQYRGLDSPIQLLTRFSYSF
ncbi:ShlB/FhaC/HecB family hemolysin secretion/activation protein [Xenorhabdus indica]|uniref:ShlB/FhaC/HecB family hemolysin secretion/activation protein n=1 Tax=Xenorhabdus indica TaxID=333964 RepID=UPI001FE57E81|nr:ShlB/FhaC/HecB family hemolysin secretion/activation protein [Xenorhabdus indica]MBC8946031.1 XhlB, XhlA hemolysin secretion/activation protein [Xenorhabdus indica]